MGITQSVIPDYLREYEHVLEIEGHGWCGLKAMIFTVAIVSELHEYGFEDRWCYQTKQDAMEALLEWSLHPERPEPLGWHRHPVTGRRRPKGDPDNEYIAP